MDHGLEYGKRLTYRIDAAYQHQEGGDELRYHLGASILGDKCARAIWFKWRWAAVEPFEGRMLRLFARGHREEEVFVDLLRRVGATVWTHDAQGNQFRVSAANGHIGGSMDGVVRGLPDFPDIPVLLELKTHRDKLFKQLLKSGLLAAHPKHYKQAQTYMHLGGLEWCLYCAVNKDTDELWMYMFQRDRVMGENLISRATEIIFNPERPPRISQTSSWFECQFCPARGVCFGFEHPKENCRTCKYARPLHDGTWGCTIGQDAIHTRPENGCDLYSVEPLMVLK